MCFFLADYCFQWYLADGRSIFVTHVDPGNTFLHCGLRMFRLHLLHACWTLRLRGSAATSGELQLGVLKVNLLVDFVRCMQCRLGGAKTGVEEEVSPGDVMVIPAGVAHERYAVSVMIERGCCACSCSIRSCTISSCTIRSCTIRSCY